VPRILLALLAAAVLTALAAASAQAAVRPLRPGDAALLNRAATAEERIAEAVAKRLTHLSPSVRCGDLGIDVPAGMLVSGITLLPPHGPADYFLMAPQMCDLLSLFRESPESYDPATCQDASCLQRASAVAFALATVSHESYHVLGYRLEKQVECYGMQSIWFVATSLGASVAEGQRIAAVYWQTTYARRQYSTPTYWSADCRDGGKYDLRPSSHAWPS
jgi:hypothetical protein